MKKTKYLAICLFIISPLVYGAEETILFKTQLTSVGQNTLDHFPADWTRPQYNADGSKVPYNTKGFIQSDPDKNRVIKSISFNLVPFSNLGEAGVDACLYVSPPSDNAANDKLTVTQNEIICFNQHKGTEQQWPQPLQQVSFPGQGIFVPKGSIVACDSQGALPSGTNAGQYSGFSNFDCEIVMDDYEENSLYGAAHQSIRAPFFDETFVNTPHSRTAFHTNMTSKALNINGVWVYNNTEGRENMICLSKSSSSSVCQIKEASVNATYSTNTDFTAFPEVWLPDESLTATCTSNTDTNIQKYCSFYFMVEIDDQNGLTRHNTIKYDSIKAYCNNPYPNNYILTSVEHRNSRNCEYTLLD